MLVQILGEKVERALDAFDPFGEVYGVGRSILALGTALTLVLSGPFDDRRAIGLAGLVLVATGWRPRITGFVHAAIAFMLQVGQIEGGRIASLLALLLLPVTVLDERRWHWCEPAPRALDARERTRRLVGRACFLLLRVQVSIFYLHASLAQLPSPEVGVVIGEWILGAGLFVRPRVRNLFLAFGVTLHFGLALAHGQWPLAVLMIGALVLYLRPLDQPFSTVMRAGLGGRIATSIRAS